MTEEASRNHTFNLGDLRPARETASCRDVHCRVVLDVKLGSGKGSVLCNNFAHSCLARIVFNERVALAEHQQT